MAGSPFAAFIGGHDRSQSLIANPSTLVGMYTQRLPAGSIAPRAFYPMPGMRRFGSVAQTGGKRFFSTAAGASRVFSVTGMRLYEWFFDGSAIDRGAVALDANPAVIFTNGDGGQQLGICAGGNFYIFDLLTNTLTQVAAMNGKATQGGFASGYFLIFDVNTGTVYQSDLFDGLIFDPANFFQRNVQADDWAGFCALSWGQVFIAGTKTRDNYYNAGTFPIPFAPAVAGIQTEGIASTFAVVEVGKRVAWLATTGLGSYKVLAAQGYEAEEISTEAINFALSRATQSEIAAATAEAASDQGQDFLLLTVGHSTYTYSFQEDTWHVRQSFVSATGGALTAWRARWHCFGFNKHLWLDANTGVAYESDIEFTTDVDDLPILRERTSPVICIGNQNLDIGDIELLIETGVGNANNPGANPVIGLEISRDGGKTWGRQRFMAIGRQGQSGDSFRVMWQGNGSGRKVAFRFRGTDAINNYRIMGLLVDLRDERGRPVDLSSYGVAA